MEDWNKETGSFALWYDSYEAWWSIHASFIVTFIWRNLPKVPTLIAEIIAKDNLNIENLMQTFEILLLQNCATKFLDITYK